MKETGEVIKIDKKSAVIKVNKKAECEKCGMCLFKKGATSMDFRAENSVGAKVGDTVIFETAERTKFLGVLLVFLVPILLVGLSVLIWVLTKIQEYFIPIICLGLLAVWFFSLSFIDKKISKSLKYKPIIISVVNIKDEKNLGTGDKNDQLKDD